MRRHDEGNQGVIIGSGHSFSPWLGLIVHDVQRNGLSILQLTPISSNTGLFEYLNELGIIEIPVGKTADDLVCQVWRKLEVLNQGSVETLQQEWRISSGELGEIEFKIKFRRREPIYTPPIDQICDFEEDYIGYRWRSDPHRRAEISRRGTRYPLDISLVRLNCDLNDSLLNEIFGDKRNEFVSAAQDLGELFMDEVIP